MKIVIRRECIDSDYFKLDENVKSFTCTEFLKLISRYTNHKISHKENVNITIEMYLDIDSLFADRHIRIEY